MDMEFESVETDLYGHLHPERSFTFVGRMRYFFQARSIESIVFERLKRLDFDSGQVEFLMTLRSETRDLNLSEFIDYLFTHRARIENVFSGFISRQDTENRAQPRYSKALNSYLQGKRVVLVGPSQHIVGTKSAELIESYDVVVRLNTQWPVPADLQEDLGVRLDILFHCCNNDTSINQILCDKIIHTKLICYELGISAFRLIRRAKDYGLATQNISETYRQLAGLLGSHPNTGTVATYLLLQSDLSELFITGMTYFKDPYYPGYLGYGNRIAHWRNGQSPKKIGPHNLEAQFSFISKLLKADSRVKFDQRLSSLLSEQQ